MVAAPFNRDDIAPLSREDEGLRRLIDLCPDALIVTTQSIVVFANPAAVRRFGTEDYPALVGRPIPDSLDGIGSAGLLRHDIVFRGCPSRLLVFREAAQPMIETIAARLRHDLAQPLNVIRLAAEGALLMIERGKIPASGWPETQFALIAEQAERTSQCLEDMSALFRPTSVSPSTDSQVPPSCASAEAHILIVGSDTALQDHFGNRPGIRVSVAATCTDAWTQFRNDPADVVVIDPDGQIGDDAGLIATLRDFDPLQPIILTPLQPDGHDSRDITNLDERLAVIAKPLDWPSLDRVIAAFLRPPAEDPITSC